MQTMNPILFNNVTQHTDNSNRDTNSFLEQLDSVGAPNFHYISLEVSVLINKSRSISITLESVVMKTNNITGNVTIISQ